MADFAVTTNFSSGTTAVSSEVNQNFEDVEDVLNGNRDSYNQVPSLVPIGGVVAWLKTFATADSGTDDAGTANKLTETGQNFVTTILVGMIVHNTTDDTFANVTAVDSNTVLSLDVDIMANGEAYIIYKTPKLADGWVECDGSAISDADSPYNGVNSPDMNGVTNATKKFLRGTISSGAVGTSFEHTHEQDASSPQKFSVDAGGPYSVAQEGYNLPQATHIPAYYEVVWIIRIK